MVSPQITHQDGLLLKDLASHCASEQKADASVSGRKGLWVLHASSFCPLLRGKKLVLLTIFERLIFRKINKNDNFPVKIT